MHYGVAAVLAGWRSATRAWEDTEPLDPGRPALAVDVTHRWVDYQLAVGSIHPDDALVIVDDQRCCVLANAGARAILGPGCVGSRFDDYLPQARADIDALWALLGRHRALQGVVELVGPSNDLVRVEVQIEIDVPLPQYAVCRVGKAAEAIRYDSVVSRARVLLNLDPVARWANRAAPVTVIARDQHLLVRLARS